MAARKPKVETGSAGGKPAPPSCTARKSVLLLLAVLLLVFAFLFRQSFDPEMVLFSNDVSLGVMKAGYYSVPEAVAGIWSDLNWLGIPIPSLPPDFSRLLALFFSPETYLKLHVPVSLLVLGLAAWVFFRQLQFHPMICFLAALAAALNSNTFSSACWGQISRPLSQAAVFLALAALQSAKFKQPWVKAALAGLAVGWGIMEGFDVGAIYSVYVGAFAMASVWICQEARAGTKLFRASARAAVVACFAALLSAHTLISLAGTQLEGMPQGDPDDPTAREGRWDFITQWSLPKIETLRVAVPGLFGYRMDTPNGGSYWGTVGQQPGWEEHRQGLVRYSGSGEYAGMFVLIVALWGVALSFRRAATPYSAEERRFIKLWAGLAVVSVFFAWGRHAPFYHFIFALPYFSTIRNPMKFMHPFHLAVVILFAYGLQGVLRLYLDPARNAAAMGIQQVKAWWGKALLFERRWTGMMFALLGLGVIGWLLYASSRKAIEQHLGAVGVQAAQIPSIAGFTIRESGLAVLLLGAMVVVALLVQSGQFSGRRSKWFWVLAGVFIVADLGRANVRWIIYHDYREKYASNPVVDFLRTDPHLRRVTSELAPATQSYLVMEASLWPAVANEWLQHHFQYYQVQSLDIIQYPRMPDLDQSYLTNFRPTTRGDLFPAGRLWELTNTRFILGETRMLPVLNQSVYSGADSLEIRLTFDIVPRPGVLEPGRVEDLTAAIRPDNAGSMALFENTKALPRARLYSKWQSSPGDASTLDQLSSREFNPREVVLVTGQVPVADADAPEEPGIVEHVVYRPKLIELRAQTTAPAVLLLNDRFDANWTVRVNGREAELLRCNYIMRGVFLEPGTHEVEFRYAPPILGLYVSLAAMASGLGMGGFLLWSGRRRLPTSPDQAGPLAPVASGAR